MSERHPLFDVLERERVALLAGDFDVLTTLAPNKEKQLSDLPHQNIGADQLRKISMAVARNQRLLKSTIEGIQTVTDRLDVLRRAKAGFSAYDQSGGRSLVGETASKFERKA